MNLLPALAVVTLLGSPLARSQEGALPSSPSTTSPDGPLPTPLPEPPVTFDEDGFFDDSAPAPDLHSPLPPKDIVFGEDGFFDDSAESTPATPSPTDPSFDADGFYDDPDADSNSGATVETGKQSSGVELSGSISMESRAFLKRGRYPGQLDTLQPSLVFEPEFSFESEDGRHQFRLSPFLRTDFEDDDRTHFDLREANYRHIGDDWDLLIGMNKVFWGVAESQHLVDIINQTDSVEDIDNEDKLGQFMINLNLIRDWGTVSVFVMPWHRPRTFPGRDGRLRPLLVVDDDDPIYESDANEFHPDLALRYSHTIGSFDLGLAFFHGTSREPTLVPNAAFTEFRPRYDLINQASIDLQYTHDALLVKFEGLIREGHGDIFGAFVGGIEYTFYQLGESAADLGFLTEYHYDGRDSSAPPTSFQNDLFLGTRLTLNDAQDTSLLAGTVLDLEEGSASAFLEAERRFGDNWKVELEGRFFLNAGDDPVLSGFRDDSFANLRVSWFF